MLASNVYGSRTKLNFHSTTGLVVFGHILMGWPSVILRVLIPRRGAFNRSASEFFGIFQQPAWLFVQVIRMTAIPKKEKAPTRPPNGQITIFNNRLAGPCHFESVFCHKKELHRIYELFANVLFDDSKQSEHSNFYAHSFVSAPFGVPNSRRPRELRGIYCASIHTMNDVTRTSKDERRRQQKIPGPRCISLRDTVHI